MKTSNKILFTYLAAVCGLFTAIQLANFRLYKATAPEARRTCLLLNDQITRTGIRVVRTNIPDFRIDESPHGRYLQINFIPDAESLRFAGDTLILHDPRHVNLNVYPPYLGWSESPAPVLEICSE